MTSPHFSWSFLYKLSNTQHNSVTKLPYQFFKPCQKQLYASTVNDNIIYCNTAHNYYLILLLSNAVLFITCYSPPHPALPVGSWSSVTQDTGAGAKIRNMLPYTNLSCSQFYKFQALNKKTLRRPINIYKSTMSVSVTCSVWSLLRRIRSAADHSIRTTLLASDSWVVRQRKMREMEFMTSSLPSIHPRTIHPSSLNRIL